MGDMDKKKKEILVFLAISERTFVQYWDFPFDPIKGMKVQFTCEDSKRGVFARFNAQITDLIDTKEENRQICVVKHLDDEEEPLMTFCFESDNWGVK